MSTYISSPVIKLQHGGAKANNLISFSAMVVLTVFIKLNPNYFEPRSTQQTPAKTLSLPHESGLKGLRDDYLFSKAAILDCSPTGPLQSFIDGEQKDGAAK